jgi:amino acid adenylation domain-containing protein
MIDVQGDGSGIREARRKVDAGLANRLRQRARALGVSAASLCHLAWALVLARVSGREDVVFGTVLFGRMQGGKGADRTPGIFINTLPARIRIDGESVRESVRQAHRLLTELLRHEHAPLALAQRCSAVKAPLPLFSALLNYRYNATPDVAAGVVEEPLPVWEGIEMLGGEERTNYPFNLNVDDLGEGFALNAQVQSPVEPDRICAYMHTALERLVEALEQTPETPMRNLNVMPASERNQLLVEWNATEAEYSSDQCIHMLFEAQAAKAPHAIAVVDGDRQLSYGELNARANRLARYLRTLNVQPDARVAILLERSIELALAELAILKCGAAYVPLDRSAPAERQAFMIEDCQAKLVLTVKNLEVLESAGVKRVNIDALSLEEQSAHNLAIPLESEMPAYVIYTSGSTGQPKGVVIPHRAIGRLVLNNGYAAFGASDRVAFTSNPAFDASTMEVWSPLLHGGCIVVIPQAELLEPYSLVDMLRRQEVDILHLVAGLLGAYAEPLIPIFPRLRYLLTGGDVVDPRAAAKILRESPPQHLIHCYGPSESTTFATTQEVEEISERAKSIPIGQPIANTQVYLLDSHGQPVPIGVAGEIYIGGAGLAHGYLNRPGLTVEQFRVDPFAGQPGARMYKTGDLGRYMAGGNIEFLGRNDFQVKIRGFRIELAEIEAQLAGHPLIREAVVLAREDGIGDKRLVAYYTTAREQGESSTEISETAEAAAPGLGADVLRSYLSTMLPKYMVPADYVALNAMPLTPNGKLDRGALPEPRGAHTACEYEPPIGATEIALANIWADLLKVERVGRYDHFFELGGHSLLAIRLIEEMRCEGLHADVRALFTNPTLAALATVVSGESGLVDIPPNLIPPGCVAITPEMLPLVQLSAADIERIVNAVPGGAANVQDIYPLAPLQEGILFHHLMTSDGDVYLMAMLLGFDTRARLESFLHTLQTVIDRHDILRTAVLWEGLPEPVQVVWRQAPLVVEEVRVEPTVSDVAKELYMRFDPRRYRLDIRRAPLMRVSIAYDALLDRWVMLHLFHHLSMDHTAMEVLLQEMHAHLQGRAEQLPAPIPFRDFVARARLGASREEDESFFREMLADVDEPTAPFGLIDVQGDGSGVREAWRDIDAGLANRLRQRARALGVSAASLCHLAWARVLTRVSGREDVVFGTVLIGRMQGGAGADRAPGIFINTLPIRIRVDGENVEESVRQTHTLLARLLKHEHAPLALAQRCSAVAPPAPLFSALLNYIHSAGADKVVASTEETFSAWEGIEMLGGEERSNYPLSLNVNDLGDRFSLKAQAQSPVEPDRICAYMRTALEQLVEALEQSPETPTRDLNALPAPERHQLLVEWNATEAEYPGDQCIHELFEAQAARAPEAIAVVNEDRQLSYGELNAQANRLAHYLCTLGVEPDARVALCMERSLEMIVGLLAILKAGGAYVPLDPAYPTERLAYMLGDSAPVMTLTHGQIPAQAQATIRSTLAAAGSPVIDLQAEAARWANEPETNPDLKSMGLMPDHLAYVIYTSGSTGHPKGVMVEHENVSRLFSATAAWYRFDHNDVWTLFHSFAFDFSVWEIWGALIHGARLIVVPQMTTHSPQEFYQLLCETGVTILNQTPSAFRQLIAAQEDNDQKHQLRYVIFGGEALEVATLKPWYQRSHNQQTLLINMYGITETTVHVTYRPLESADTERSGGSPIGRRIPDLKVYLLDRHGQPVPIGVEGEIYVSGGGVARGYLNRPDLTADRFVPVTFADETNPQMYRRMYRTGDLGRYQSDGTIEFLGRNDFQVKIRGFRIELGEIEARLAQHPAIREAVVLAREDSPGDKWLVAYYTVAGAGGGDGAIDADELRAWLSAALPVYMLPAWFVRVERMPMTPNSKVDRRALAAVEVKGSEDRTDYVAPRTPVEEILVEIFAEVLKLDRVGIYDNFFEIGGHSLLATRVISRVKSTFDVGIEVRSIFEEATVAKLAEVLIAQEPKPGQVEKIALILKKLNNMTEEDVDAELAALEQ